jgi:hypothetical protein
VLPSQPRIKRIVEDSYTRDTYTSVYPQLARDAAENTAALLRD